jgi:hypothetical protein
MKPSPLRTLLAPALILAAILGPVRADADEIQDLTMKKSGQVRVITSSYGDLLIIPVLNDVSTGTWKGLKFLTPFQENSGMTVEGKGAFQALEGQPVNLQVDVQAKNNIINAQASWLAERPVKGHGRLDLFIGSEAIKQLTASCDGEEVNLQKPPTQIKVNDEFQFHKKSDGKPAMRLVFPEGPYKVSFVSDGGSLDKSIGPGMIMRISPRADSNEEPSLDAPRECKWQLVFEK